MLIPDLPDFVPQPAQMTAFFEGLIRHGSAPQKATIRIAKLSGKVRTGSNAFTGETITIPAREFVSLQDIHAISQGLQGLDDYTVYFSGQGPAEHPPFKLYMASDPQCQSEIETAQWYEVNGNLRKSAVSLSEASWMEPCVSDGSEGVFLNPWNNETIIVQNAACALFWIEFMFGNWLVPKIEKSLELLPSSILALASEIFEVSFVQGGRFD